jgi:hypothetical protein
MRMPAYPSSPSLESVPAVANPWADVPSSRHDVDIQRAAMMMERPQFVIDDMADGDDDEEYGAEGDRDADLLVEVDNFLADGDNTLNEKAAQAGQGTSAALLLSPA